jgi:formylglycine-generating enzyme required for sulfatase activity
MTGTKINPALKYIQTVGVTAFVSGVRLGAITDQKIPLLNAVGNAIDAYVEARPQDTALTGLRKNISGLPAQGSIDTEAQEEILGQLTTHKDDVELAVRMAIKINTVAQVANLGGTAVANLDAPFYLGDEWCWIPPGEFQMGSRDDDEYADDNEKPLRMIMTGGFFMLDHPVTNAEFREFLVAKVGWDVRNLENEFAGDDQPAVEVTHEKACSYSKWFGEEVSKRTGHEVIGRLPTEAEWEKAAKGPNGDEFIVPATRFQAHFDEYATRSVNHPLAYANGYGLKDMIGNVWEWTSSPWGDTSNFATRGASWRDGLPHDMRAAFRNYAHPGGHGSNFGFRPILVPQDSEE